MATCPQDYPNILNNGKNCCKYREKVNNLTTNANCDGSYMRAEDPLECCIGNQHIPCPHSLCKTHWRGFLRNGIVTSRSVLLFGIVKNTSFPVTHLFVMSPDIGLAKTFSMDQPFASNMNIDTTGYTTKAQYTSRQTVHYKNSLILCGGTHPSLTQPYSDCDKYNTETGKFYH